MEPLLIRENEAIAFLGIGRTTFWRLIRAGEIKSVTIGRARRFPVADLKDWVGRQIEDEERRRSGRANSDLEDAA